MQTATSILTLLKATLFVFVGFVIATAGVVHRSALGKVIDDLPNLVGHMSTMKVAGVEIGFTNASIDLSADLRNLPATERRSILAAIGKLGPDSFVRLFYVQDQNFCEYDNPDLETRRSVQAHFELAALKLVELSKMQKLPDRHAAFGNPNKCYSMKLTDLGWRVKTELLTSIGRAFRDRSPTA